MFRKKLNALLSCMLAAGLFMTALPLNVRAEEVNSQAGKTTVAETRNSGYVTEEDLADNSTEAPAKDAVIPDSNQYEYHKQELAAFCHFGPNTFNEIEWGEHYGNREPGEIFTLTENFDAETMVKTLKDAGFKKLIVTAKHHDGFCVWNSEHTDYDLETTPYAAKNYDGKGGDILWEISEACTKNDMDMGLYLSPWDIHEPSYGYKDANGNGTTPDKDVLDYNEFYNNQLEEILGNDKYGNNGHFNEIWMDGAKGSGANAQEYDFQRWFDTIQKHEGKAAGYESDCMLFGAYAYTAVRWIGNESGYAAEENWAQCKAYFDRTGEESFNANQVGEYRKGFPDGNIWTVPEADARITSGWFWGTTKATPKSVEALAEMYFRSVGHNATLLLNVPPNNKGTVDQAILDRVTEFGDNVRDTFRTNMALDATVVANEVRGNDIAYKPGNVVDGDDATYWTVNDGSNTGTLVVDLGDTKTFDVVSIEESIEFGQRINSFKVEYRNGDDEWKVFDEGTTIGSKRLSRKSPVKADELRITVSTDSKVPMIAEVAVYKASEGFELGSAAPDGMEVIDKTDSAFKFQGGWNPETGDQYLNGTNSWCNEGASFEVSFTGTKIYLVGTEDPNHGTADIYIDGTKVASINTHVASRKVGQHIFESETLSSGEHTLKLVATGTIGIEGAYVINNGGLGMIGIEEAKYTMNEDSELEVKLVRVGGSTGEAVVEFTPNPGSAIQDDYDTEANYVITFAEGETEKKAIVRTRRNTNRTGTQYFTVELASSTKDLILGFNSRARINIIDAEELDAEDLQKLVDQYTSEVIPMAQTYTADSWAAFETAFNAAVDKLKKDELTLAEVKAAYEALEAAKTALVVRDTETGIYTADDRFQFPGIGESVVLEMEYTERHNNTEGDNGWPLQVSEADWASNGKFLNCLNGNDSAVLYYNAARTGIYTVVASYRSGDPNNSVICSEADGKIAGGEVTAGASDSAGATHTVTFEFVVLTAGDGVLTFKGGASKAPQLDKVVITAKDLDAYTYAVTKTAGENGTITGPDTVTETEDAVFTITPNKGYLVEDVKVNGVSVGAVTSYTVENVNADITIQATFKVKPIVYSAEEPFVFPTEGSAVLEMEYLEQHNNTANDNGWPLQITEATWASNGKFLNCLNPNDQAVLYYNAPKAGTYTAVVSYRSGDPNNSLVWTEAEGKIAQGSVSAGAGDSAGATHTATFEFEVTTAGAGVLTFKGGPSKAPQLDKIEITAKAEEPPVVVNKAELEAKIAEAEAKNAEVYTEESYALLAEKLAVAKEVVSKAEATQAEVDAMAKAITDAIAALEEKVIAKSYSVTYELNGGKNNSENPESYTEGNAEIKLQAPTRKGYEFVNWYKNENLTGKVTKIKANSTGDKTFYAKWKKETYTITYKLDGGKNSKSNPKSYQVTTKTFKLKTPTKKGYDFKGWYSDKAFTKKVSSIKQGSAGKVTLYAKWTPVTYKITYKLNGGNNSNRNPKSYTVESSKITLKSPTRSGYKFVGWYSNKSLTKKVTKISKGSTGNVTLYAKWKKK